VDSNFRVAVITGAASGIGLALSKACVASGIHVVMADNRVTALCDRVEQLSETATSEVMGVVCEVSKIECLRQLAKQTFERFERIDWLFNNAGISGHFAPVWELTSEHIRKVMDINLYGVLNGIQAFLPLMFKQTHRAHIINMASCYGLCSGSQVSAYSMSNHAIVALSESLYFDLERLQKPVSVSVVCPSFTNTQLLANSTPLHEDRLHAKLSEFITQSRPAEEVAAYILKEIKKGTFYILPDDEVKYFCEQRTKAIMDEQQPYSHQLEKIMSSFSQSALLE